MKVITLCFILFLGLIVFLANTGSAPEFFTTMARIPGSDLTGHFFLMGTLSFLFNLSLSCNKIRLLNFQLLKGSLIVTVLVTLEEFSQIFVTSRTFSFSDLAADYAGIFCFSLLALISRGKIRVKINKKS